MVQLCGKQYGASSKNSKIEKPHDPEIPGLGTYLKNETGIQQVLCTMSTAGLFTIAKKLRKSKYSLIDEGITKMYYIHIIKWNIIQPEKGQQF